MAPRLIKSVYMHSHKRNKKKNYAVNILSVLIASTGVITGCITFNSIVLSVLTTAGIKSHHEFRKIKAIKTNRRFTKIQCYVI